jgi:hypothetical protein
MVSYGYLFRAGFILQASQYPTLLPRAFNYFLDPKLKCDLSPTSIANVNETSGSCQLDLKTFSAFVQQIGIPLHQPYIEQLFHALDRSRNGYVSWGEINAKYYQKPAMEYYLHQWRNMEWERVLIITPLEWVDYRKSGEQ